MLLHLPESSHHTRYQLCAQGLHASPLAGRPENSLSGGAGADSGRCHPPTARASRDMCALFMWLIGVFTEGDVYTL